MSILQCNNGKVEGIMVNERVNGKSEVFGVIGNPIHHTFSPCIQNSCADLMGKNMIYVPFHVLEDKLEDAIKGAFGLKIKGLNVTVPHKKAVMKFLCATDKRAEAIGAVNTLKYTENGYRGYNTDIIGIDYSFKERGISLKGKNVLLLGAGGSACAAAVLAAESEVNGLIIANRTVSRADELKKNIESFYKCNINVISTEDIDSVEKCDIIINTTTVGFGDKADISLIKDRSFFNKKGVQAVFDTIYIPWETRLIQDAKNEGITAINGFDMLIYQAAAAQEIWFDEKYDEEKMKKMKDELEIYYKKINNVK